MNAESGQLPYNTKNRLIDQSDVLSLLEYGNICIINNINIYRRAFVHKSYCTRKNENYLDGNLKCPDECMPLQEESNERLEFLGDSILNLIVASYLFERYPGVNEGFLTTMRTKLVNGKMLAFLSGQINLGNFVIMSQQIEGNDGRKNKNILEDTFEAFIAAIYLDFDQESIHHNSSGFDTAKKWVVSIIEEHVDFTELMKVNINYKDKLIKTCQHQYQFIPKFFEIDVTERNCEREHTICVRNNVNEIIGVGKGSSKKLAEIEASKKALTYYGFDTPA
jgi:ribonuclease-3